MPSRAPATETPIPVAIDLDTCSRACSRSAWAISWPITAAISSSVRLSRSMSPV